MTEARESRAATEVRPQSTGRGCLPRWFGVSLTVSGLVLLSAWGQGCSAQAGMFCLQQSDCRPGLVCNKPPSASRPEQYGICEPARRASGEICQRSSDCASGLRCSTELGTDSPDDRHGRCVFIDDSPLDGGSSDLGDAASRD